MCDIKILKTETIAFGAMYIIPDGTMLDLSLLPNGHADYFDFAKTSPYDLSRQGWVRLNTKLKYIELPVTPLTEQQKEKLKLIIKFMGNDIQIKNGYNT